MTYKHLYKPAFLADLQTYASLKQQVKKKIKTIVANPYHNTEPLSKVGKYDLRGLKSKRIDKNFRIIFAICEECQKKLSESNRPCFICDPELPGRTVIFFAFGPHKEIYKQTKPPRLK